MMNRPDSVVVNGIVRQALVSSEEVMGSNGLNAVMRSAGLERFVGNFPPNDMNPSINTSDYAHLNQAIEDFYGRAAKGMLRRIGKASFQYGVREQAALLGVAGVALKLLPRKQRIMFILNGMADALKKSNKEVDAWMEEKNNTVAFVDRSCAVCWGRESTQPVCHLYIGSVGEAVLWATGVEHEIIETHCMARGDEYCRFEVGAPKE
jgi:predicted hydrocarbon binding protein